MSVGKLAIISTPLALALIVIVFGCRKSPPASSLPAKCPAGAECRNEDSAPAFSSKPVEGAASNTKNSSLQGQPASRDPGGWTKFNLSADSKQVYVSSSLGNDRNSGTSPDDAVKTLDRGTSLVRDGYPDHLLLRRGDQWTDESLGMFVSGRNEKERLVVSSYGESQERPLLRISSDFINHHGRTRSHLAFIGLSVIGYKFDPKDPAFDGKNGVEVRFVGGGDNILVEDCKLQFVGLILQNYDGGVYRNIELRRNIIVDHYALDTSTSNKRRPSGLYADKATKLLMEENVFDHNGWSEVVPGAGANMYNHNVYLQFGPRSEDIVFRNNIVARGSSHGVHGRPGGLYENNLFVANSVGLQIGYKGHPLPPGSISVVRNNVILDGKLMDPADTHRPRTAAVWGLMLDELAGTDVLLEGNIVAHRRDDGVNIGIAKDPGARYVGNIQYKWGNGVGDSEDPGWVDPDRSVASYNQSLGGKPSLDAFLAVVRNRLPGHWDPQYSAHAVNEYLRAGFRLKGASPE